MINILTKEYKEGNLAVKTTEVTFFGFIVYTNKYTTTNNEIVATLTRNKQNKVKGFYETKNKSKEKVS